MSLTIVTPTFAGTESPRRAELIPHLQSSKAAMIYSPSHQGNTQQHPPGNKVGALHDALPYDKFYKKLYANNDQAKSFSSTDFSTLAASPFHCPPELEKYKTPKSVGTRRSKTKFGHNRSKSQTVSLPELQSKKRYDKAAFTVTIHDHYQQKKDYLLPPQDVLEENTRKSLSSTTKWQCEYTPIRPSSAKENKTHNQSTPPTQSRQRPQTAQETSTLFTTTSVTPLVSPATTTTITKSGASPRMATSRSTQAFPKHTVEGKNFVNSPIGSYTLLAPKIATPEQILDDLTEIQKSHTVQPYSAYDNRLPWYEQRALKKKKQTEYQNKKKEMTESKSEPMFGVTSKGLTKITGYIEKKTKTIVPKKKEEEGILSDAYISQLLSNL